MTSEVYAISFRTHFRENINQKILRLFEALRPEKLVSARSIWAIKIHFGEEGCHTFIRPHLVRIFVEALKKRQAKPFLTDSNTLYIGGRINSVDHLETAIRHGFGFEATGAPLIIADGLKGASAVPVEVGRGGVDKAWIGADVAAADGILVLSHFKGHELTGFGGALKNLGMGSASRRGKLDQHSDLKPKVVRRKCIGCGRCLKHCAHGALRLAEAVPQPGIYAWRSQSIGKGADLYAAGATATNCQSQPGGGHNGNLTINGQGESLPDGSRKAAIDSERCVGCAACIPVCPAEAIAIPWEKDAPKVMRKMVEYAKAALHGKGRRALFVNFLTDISPLCDCNNHSDAPIVQNLGLMASHDPVALDAASAEAVNQAQGLPGSALPVEALAAGTDKWTALHPDCPWRYQLEYAEEIGLGTMDYKLVWLPEVKGI